MARLEWGKGNFRQGLDQGAIFLPDGSAEPWVGLSKVTQNPIDGRVLVTYRDGRKLVNARSEDSFSATVEAYTYPDAVIGSIFGLTYRVQTESGYRTHLVYNARAKMSGYNYQMNEIDPFTFDITTTPVPIPGAMPSAHLVINEAAYSWTREALEDILYGNEEHNARLPLPDEILELFNVNALLQVIDNEDGTWTATGPAEAIQMLDDKTFAISWPSAVMIDAGSYTIYSF